MGELTQEELRAVRQILTHFLDGGWTEIVERLTDEKSDALFDAVESAHAKLSRLARGAAA
jgi:hypothetical protein